jgi:trimethylamine corrinoid protein
MDEEWVQKILDSMLSLDEDNLLREIENALENGFSAIDIIKNAITKGLKIVGEKYENGEFFLMHLMAIGEAVKMAMDKYLTPRLLASSDMEAESEGTIVIGTVEGDIHDIGKNIVSSMLLTSGFKVIDLGKDISCERFIDEAIKNKANIIAASALLSTTMTVQKKLIELLKKKKLRGKFKVMVGGAPTSPDWANEIGADGYGKDAIDAVRVAKKILNK